MPLGLEDIKGGCNPNFNQSCYPNINLRGGVIQVEANFFDLNAELKTIFNQQKQI